MNRYIISACSLALTTIVLAWASSAFLYQTKLRMSDIIAKVIENESQQIIIDNDIGVSTLEENFRF